MTGDAAPYSYPPPPPMPPGLPPRPFPAGDADRVIAVLTERIDSLRGDFNTLRIDHEGRIKSLESSRDQQTGAWKLLTAGGAAGAAFAALAFGVGKALGL